MAETTSDILSGSPVARLARVPLRVVFRRERMTPRQLDAALVRGELQAGAGAVCDLVSGDTVIATGELVEREGRYQFVAKEAKK